LNKPQAAATAATIMQHQIQHMLVYADGFAVTYPQLTTTDDPTYEVGDGNTEETNGGGANSADDAGQTKLPLANGGKGGHGKTALPDPFASFEGKHTKKSKKQRQHNDQPFVGKKGALSADQATMMQRRAYGARHPPCGDLHMSCT
jgi:hypothetical protein